MGPNGVSQGELCTFGGPENSTVESSIFRSKVLLPNFPNVPTFQKCEGSQIKIWEKFYLRTLANTFFALLKSAKDAKKNFWPGIFSYNSKL